MRAKITQGLANRLKPEAQDYIVWDTALKGFGLKVTPAGRKVFLVYYRTMGGQQRKPAIGTTAEFSADKARKVAKSWLADATKGGDVSGKRQAAREAETVKELGERYLIEHAEAHKKPLSIAADRRNLENHIYPQIGRLKIQEVTPGEIARVKMAVMTGKTARELPGTKPRGRRVIRGGPIVANRVLALLSKMFACAVAWGLCTDNPARGVQKFKEKPRQRFLDANEIRRVSVALTKTEKERGETQYVTAALRFLMLTGLRRGEVTGLRWKQIDMKAGLVRFEDTKTGPRTVPLGTAARDVLARLPEGDPDELVFQSGKAGAQIALTRPWHRIRKAAELDVSVTIHSLRHTFGSWSVMGGLSLAETGAMLGHRSAQTTLRYAHHLQDAVQKNAERISGTISAAGAGKGGRVVRFGKNGATGADSRAPHGR